MPQLDQNLLNSLVRMVWPFSLPYVYLSMQNCCVCFVYQNNHLNKHHIGFGSKICYQPYGMHSKVFSLQIEFSFNRRDLFGISIAEFYLCFHKSSLELSPLYMLDDLLNYILKKEKICHIRYKKKPSPWLTGIIEWKLYELELDWNE